MRRSNLFLATAILAFTGGSLANGAVHVLQAGASIQNAIDAAADGDTILLEAGFYEVFSLQAKSLTITAEKDAHVEIKYLFGSLLEINHISNLAANQTVTIRGVVGSSFSVQNCAGHVRFEDCSMPGISGTCDGEWGFFTLARPALQVGGSPRVALNNCTVTAAPGGYASGPILTCCNPGAPGIIAANSTVVVYRGSVAPTSPFTQACASAPAVQASQGAIVTLYDEFAIGKRNLIATSPLRRGESGNLHLDYAAGDSLILFLSVAPAFMKAPPYPGIFLGLPLVGVFPIGTLPGKSFDLPIQFNDIPSPGIAAFDLQLQGAYVPISGTPVIGPMTVITLLDPAF